MNRTTRMLAVLFLTLGVSIAGNASAAEQCTINEFGGPRRFADQGAPTISALQGIFEVHRHDIEKLLGEVGWVGEPGDLFNAVAQGEVQEEEFPPGTPFQWMMLRYKGVAQITLDKCWGGKEAFVGWRITIESGGYRSNFVVPKDCGNLALTGAEKLPPPPPPTPPPPTPTPAQPAPTPDPGDTGDTGDDSTAMAGAGTGEGAAAGSGTGAAVAAGAGAAAAGMGDDDAMDDDMDDMSDADAGFFGNCRVRLFGAKSYADETRHTDENVGTIDEERTQATLDNGSGGGVEGECMITPRLGIPLTLMFLSQDSHVMYDDVNVWLMDSADVDWLSLTTGVNYHFMEPESKFNLFIGPFIGYVNFDDPSYKLGDETVKASLDNEFTWGVHLGFDVPARDGWAFYAGVRYFDLDLEMQGADMEFEMNPIVVGAGVSYKF